MKQTIVNKEKINSLLIQGKIQMIKGLKKIYFIFLNGCHKINVFLINILPKIIAKIYLVYLRCQKRYKHLSFYFTKRQNNLFFNRQTIAGGVILLLIFFCLSESAIVYSATGQGSNQAENLSDQTEEIIEFGSPIIYPQENITKQNISEGDYLAMIDNFSQLTMSLDHSALIGQKFIGQSLAPIRNNITEYMVKSGDTAGGIAQRFGLKLSTLLWNNKLNWRATIRPKQKLTILPTDGILHTVKKNQTINGIAKLYKANSEKIVDFNHLAGSLIQAGDKLIVPNGQMPYTPAPVTIKPKTTYMSTTEIGKKSHRFPWGQCTWYVAQKRYVPWRGHAKNWLTNARQAGFTIGNTPEVGTILVLKAPNSWAGRRYGHVAYVEEVTSTHITFSEMNFVGLGKKSHRTFKINDWRIVGYIY